MKDIMAPVTHQQSKLLAHQNQKYWVFKENMDDIDLLLFICFSFKAKKKGKLFQSLFWSAGSSILYANLLQLIALAFQVLSPQIFR